MLFQVLDQVSLLLHHLLQAGALSVTQRTAEIPFSHVETVTLLDSSVCLERRLVIFYIYPVKPKTNPMKKSKA